MWPVWMHPEVRGYKLHRDGESWLWVCEGRDRLIVYTRSGALALVVHDWTNRLAGSGGDLFVWWDDGNENWKVNLGIREGEHEAWARGPTQVQALCNAVYEASLRLPSAPLLQRAEEKDKG